MSMIIYDCEQRSLEWMRLRTGRITASNAHRLTTDAKRETYQYALLAETITGLLDETFVSDAMQWGIDQEEFAMEWYEKQDPSRELRRVGFCQSKEFLIAGCSPDLLVDEDGLCEIKCPTSKNHLLYWNEGPSSEYIYQMQFQMLITGREWTDFLTYDPRFPSAFQGKVHHIKRDEKIIGKLIKGIKEIELFIDTFMLDNNAKSYIDIPSQENEKYIPEYLPEDYLMV